MLTSDLLRARVKGDQVSPRWLVARGEEPPPEVLERARGVIELFHDCAGRPRLDLKDGLRALIAASPEPKVERGFAKLLEDRADFEAESRAEPAQVRRVVFDLAARAREEGRFERGAVLAGAAQALGLADTAEVESSLWADLRDHERLSAPPETTPAQLVHRYDVALAQAVLLRAERLRVQVDVDAPRARRLISVLKFHRLLFRAAPTGEGLSLELDGPLSLFGPSTRYGLRLAEAFPHLLHLGRFSLEADVRWTRRRLRKRFLLSHEDGLRPVSADRGSFSPPEVDFFAKRFAEARSVWDVSTRNVPLVSLGGEDVLVPDLGFVHRETGQEAYLELLGHWRRRSLERRLALLKKHAPRDVIVAVARGLASDERALERELPVEVVLFSEVLSVREVLARLERIAVRGARRRGPS